MSNNVLFNGVYNGSVQMVRNIDGVRITTGDDRFEINVLPHTEIWEQTVVQQLRIWVRERKAKEDLREPSNLPG